uniref:Putative conserved plasma membrane protein n=1 Tax=Ixodes ricinus TaxID=34613 RepID=A0A090XCU4_IXORI
MCLIGFCRTHLLRPKVLVRTQHRWQLHHHHHQMDATTLSNVGGFMGMYLGLSFLVIFEILEIFVRWFIYLYRRRRRAKATGGKVGRCSTTETHCPRAKAQEYRKQGPSRSSIRFPIWHIMRQSRVNPGFHGGASEGSSVWLL